MAEKRLRTIEFRGLGTTYTIPEVDPTSSVTGNAADAKVVGDHIKDKENPHGVTVEQIGAAPSGYGLGEKTARIVSDADAAKTNGFYAMSGNSAVNYPANYPNFCYGSLFVEVRYTNAIFQTIRFANISAERYSNDGGTTWSAWEYINPPLQVGVQYRTTMRDNGKALYLERGSNGAIFYRRDGEDTWYGSASRIDGTFANIVAAKSTAQDPATRQLRNSTIVSTETNPSYNGEICWVYE